jgi:hypothetical protein
LADLRAAQGEVWVNRCLHQYHLDTAEGVALLSLGEAFLRIPESETADPRQDRRRRLGSSQGPIRFAAGQFTASSGGGNASLLNIGDIAEI